MNRNKFFKEKWSSEGYTKSKPFRNAEGKLGSQCSYNNTQLFRSVPETGDTATTLNNKSLKGGI